MPNTDKERSVLLTNLREAYMEIFPASGIAEESETLQPNSFVAVTCSPTKGIDDTLALTQVLVERGFRVVPHIAARNVRDRDHLKQTIRRLQDLEIESLFVPGGDRTKPVGKFSNAYELLKAINDIEHNIKEIGIAAHPEGHPEVSEDALFAELEKKQQFAQYAVTQMCFEADVLGNWVQDIRNRGINLPVWLGLPGAIDRSRLLKTSFRIGVGDSLRFLRRKSSVAARLVKSNVYRPDDLVRGLARYQADSALKIAGYHLFCFNQVKSTEEWRNDMIESLS